MPPWNQGKPAQPSPPAFLNPFWHDSQVRKTHLHAARHQLLTEHECDAHLTFVAAGSGFLSARPTLSPMAHSRAPQASTFRRRSAPQTAVSGLGQNIAGKILHRKEVIQPQVPLRLPCYDFIPVTSCTLGPCLLAVGADTSGATGSHDVTGGVYKTRERIHGAVADAPLLAIPASWRRVAASNPN